VKGFIFYMPGDNDDEMLGKKDLLITDDDSDDDGGGGGDDDGDDDNNWMVRIKHPVFAVSGSIGELMMQHMSLYSGNMTEVPFGQDIRKKFNTHEHDYLRVWTELVVKTPPAPFGSWVWAFVVVGLVVGVFAVTSGVMEVVQWQRRAKLRKKVRDGEVDLEGMGIVRRGRLPREVVEGFPLWTYCDPTTTCANETPDRTTSTAPTTDETTTSMATRTSESSTACERSSDLSYQPACPICLVPFQPLVTTIRELPCGHIFHPSCIDTLLLHTTSLCPVCKTSMLPPGYCPKITNGMVRRERALRKLRGELPGEMSWWDYLRRRSGVKSQARKEGRRSSQMELRVMVKQNRGESEDLSGAWQSKEHETVIPPAALARARCRDDDHAKNKYVYFGASVDLWIDADSFLAQHIYHRGFPGFRSFPVIGLHN